MKNIKKMYISFLLCIVMVFAMTTSVLSASADTLKVADKVSEVKKNESYSENKGQSLQTAFANKSISSCEFIYNLDDSADYIYVEFKGGGYAIFSKNTMEMMEYSMEGSLPLSDSTDKYYYAGPSNYLQKANNKFINAITKEEIGITEIEAKTFSEQIRNVINYDKTCAINVDVNNNNIREVVSNFLQSEKDVSLNDKAPDIDTTHLIRPAAGTGNLIANYRYFDTNPTHGNNYTGGAYGNGNSGTCGSVAAQILLGYNNYYNDRRIIENRFLNGYDDSSNSVKYPERNPNVCTDPMSMTSWTTGTRSEDTGTNSFYSKVITSIMKPNTSGASLKEVCSGINRILNEHLSIDDYKIYYEFRGWLFGYAPVSSELIKSEINAGRPLIISLSSHLGATDHQVVGYGYQDYTYPNNGGTYSGYIVHFGWQGDNCVWVNSSWCKGYISLKMNHTHIYSAVGTISGTTRTEYKCNTCGHRTDAAINMNDNDRYIERKVDLPNIHGNTYQDYYVTFQTSGNKLFQTFGEYDVAMYLFDSDYKQLAFDDDSGHDLNALFSYTVYADTAYVLRVKSYDTENMGISKIGITPASVAYSTYESIQSIYNNEIISFNANVNTTKVFCFISQSFGYYRISTVSNDGIDGYLYLIDPESLNDCIFDDDSAGNLQALIEEYLEANKTYFLVVSTYNIAVQSGNLQLSIRKIY